MILMIDNYDSFTYNLVQYFGEVAPSYPIEVVRNDKISLHEIEVKKPKALVLSPGPGTPQDAGITLCAINHFKGQIPILGICLGHQAIAEAFGGEVVLAKKVMHGKTSQIDHDEQFIFHGIPMPLSVMRYHSLIVERESFPGELIVTAETNEGEIMGLRHRHFPIEGVQFHPESILSEYGRELIRNFVEVYIISK